MPTFLRGDIVRDRHGNVFMVLGKGLPPPYGSPGSYQVRWTGEDSGEDEVILRDASLVERVGVDPDGRLVRAYEALHRYSGVPLPSSADTCPGCASA